MNTLEETLYDLHNCTEDSPDQCVKRINQIKGQIQTLVIGAKPEKKKETWYNKDLITTEEKLRESCIRYYNKALDQYEASLLNVLGGKK